MGVGWHRGVGFETKMSPQSAWLMRSRVLRAWTMAKLKGPWMNVLLCVRLTQHRNGIRL